MLAVDQSKLDGQGYPGTTVVYAGVPTSGLPQAEAENYAKFLEYAADGGQQYGVEIGNLPLGYLALSDPLKLQTRNAATAVREQKGDVPAPPDDVITDPAKGLPDPNTGGGGSPTTNNVVGGANRTTTPTGPASAPVPPDPSGSTPSSVGKPVTSAATRADSSSFARWILPVLLGVGLLAAVLVPLVPALGTPGHPVRRWLAARFGRGAE
ncbi:hypothetical protein ACFWW9_46125, partial [Umezawaea sp. NPDC059074]